MNRSFYSCLVMLIACAALQAQNFNRPVPARVPGYKFERPGNEASSVYYLTAPFPLAHVGTGSSDFPKTAMILDANGYLVWYMPVYSENVVDFKYLPELNKYSLINYRNVNDIGFQLLDSTLQSSAEFTLANNLIPDGHEFKHTLANTWLIGGLSDSIMDLSGSVFNGAPGSAQTHVIGFVVQEIDDDNNVLFQWNSNDHILPTQANAIYGYNPNYFDYCHGNAIEEYNDTSLLVSFRNLDAVYCIHRRTGAVLWQLGGKSSTFTLPNDLGFSGQHDVRLLPNGDISMFDNNNDNSLPFSRAVEYHLDTVQKTATKTWEYIYLPFFKSIAMGSFQTTANNLRVINYGFSFRPNPSFVVVNQNKALQSRLSFADSFLVYRSYIFDLPFNESKRPLINCSQSADTITLSAPDGYAQYEWSTGAHTQSIAVAQPGEYQVWVNYGSGMIGSFPLKIDAVDHFCTVNQTELPEDETEPEVLGIYNLLGQPVRSDFYLVRYSNGKVKAVIRK